MVGNFIHYISRFLAGFLIGFLRVWQISLVTLSIVPLIALSGGVYAYIATGLIARIRKSYIKAGEIAEEVIGNVRTVQAFAGEDKAVRAYRSALLNTYKYGKRAGLAKGLGLGSLHCTLFFSWALLVWFVSVVVHKHISNRGESFTTMLNVVIAGLGMIAGIFYARELVEPSKRSFIRGQIAGIFYGIAQFFIFSSYGLALWYGSVLLGKELASFKSIMKSFMVLIVTALAMGETLALVPDILRGNQMAASVFEILDRKTAVMGDKQTKDLSKGFRNMIRRDASLFAQEDQMDIQVTERSDSSASDLISIRFITPAFG